LNGCLRALEGPEGAGAALGDNSTLLAKIRKITAQPADPATPLPEEPKPAGAPADGEAVVATVSAADSRVRSGSRSVKIDTEKLDYMVDMVGEMVIAQSLIRYDPDLHLQAQPRLARNLSQLARITNEVQRTAMSMRMVPIAGLFQKMARLVRDLARKSGKSATFESVGDEVELDRHIVEELADPLMHMIRNAVDHGIEPAAERVKGGKEANAKVKLSAMHQAGQIIIQVADDGQGLSREKILAKARAQGLIAPTAEPSDSEVFNFIFHPGFSTAAQVSDVSGRGVGMDVVRKQIQKLRGTVDIQTKAGQGTTFSLKLPLTLAIIEGLIVAVGGHRYVIPIFSVKELFRPNAETIFTVENRSEMVLVRDRLVPVVRLYERFRVQSQTAEARNAVFVLAESDNRLFCLMVDSVIGKQEVVIKSLGTMFQSVRGIAGGAILGDGHVALILDPMALFGALQGRVR
jgi:two-component system chemotaxis sensor kinase CheA